MVKGERRKDSGAGELLYTEAIPKRLQPRRLLAGKRWSYLEKAGRILALALVFYIIYQLFYVDLSVTSNLVNLVAEVVVVILLVYATEVLSPRGRRQSTPIRIYSKGMLVFTSTLETLLGKPSWISKEMISKLQVRRLMVDHEGKQIMMPTNLKLVLTNGKIIDLGRRNYNELYNMIKIIEEKYGVPE